MEIRQTQLEGCGLHVRDTGGDGHAVVLVHGWPLSGAAWEAQFPALHSAGYRAIAYDRRGFGQSKKPETGYGYDVLADDLAAMVDEMDLAEFSLVGFSMGGGEAARYPGRYGESRLKSVVFASAVPPCLMQSEDNPDGPLSPEDFKQMRDAVSNDRDGFLEQFTRDFFSVEGELKTSEEERQKALQLCKQAKQSAMEETMDAWAETDFRADLDTLCRPVLVLHGDSDGIVPFEGSGKRTAERISSARSQLIEGGPHGINTTHADEFNEALIGFLNAL
ncbi:alpha/beta fold hydrolase [Granulosicoccus sp. 3-233]|uniref:alpha/beta fold hydrolase n=1 Tax=Granulosicoccus sp. 3-233 TaxID=3417969 RepID=UPI003D32D745